MTLFDGKGNMANGHGESRIVTLQELMTKVRAWKILLAEWQIGKRGPSDPERKAIEDMRDALITQRIEMNAMWSLMIGKGLITQAEMGQVIGQAADALDQGYATMYPGYESVPDSQLVPTGQGSMKIVDMEKAAKTTEGWKP